MPAPGRGGTTTYYSARRPAAQAHAPVWRAADLCCPNTTLGCVLLNVRFMLATLRGAALGLAARFDGVTGGFRLWPPVLKARVSSLLGLLDTIDCG
jgi:hypothetical protein